ncbi:MAG: sigma-70 family RNA polymerase sigma factor, partial [Erysipelotrichaceae bacterium]|nr:sigma-70 family RNA polymerase sigma factor [Erysipelotrichaceae bacterium]
MDSYGSDEELLYLMRCGYEEAEVLLYKRYYRLMYRWIYPVVSHHNELDYNDYVQMAMMYLGNIFDSYRDDYQTSLRHFAKQAIVKKMVSILKVKVNKKESYPSLNNWIDDEKKLRFDDIIADPKSYCHPEKVLAVKEASTQYYTAIDKLASQIEKDVMMYLQEGYSEKEIAEIMNINIKSIYNVNVIKLRFGDIPLLKNEK